MKKRYVTLLFPSLLASYDLITPEHLNNWIKYKQVLSNSSDSYGAETGSTIGVRVGLVTEKYRGFTGHLTFMYSGNTFLLDRDKRVASGYYLDSNYESKSILAESYLNYQNGDFVFTGGRRHPNYTLKCESENPMTRYSFSIVPNLFEAYGVKYRGFENTTVGFSYISKFAFGSRATTDYSYIGEYTNSAGVAVNPSQIKGEFQSIEDIAGVENGSDGIGMVGFMTTPSSTWRFQLWNYYAENISNILYSQIDYNTQFSNWKTLFSLQVLNQKEVGNGIEDKFDGDLDFTMVGGMVSLENEKWLFELSSTQSFGDQMFNFFGMDPSFTNSIYTRNSYREDVFAYKLGASYQLLDSLELSLAHTVHSKSKTLGGSKTETNLEAVRDAVETDIILTYEPIENLSIKLLQIYRVSEYDFANQDDSTTTHRLSVTYEF